MNGKTTDRTTKVYKINEDVTKVRSQLQMNAMIRAARIVLLNCRSVPRRSEIPSCSVFDVVVIAVSGAPGGMASMTWIDCTNSDCK